MEFGKEKCVMLITKKRKRRKRKSSEGIELSNQENIRTLEEKENNKYLGILEVDTIKYKEMKQNVMTM